MDLIEFGDVSEPGNAVWAQLEKELSAAGAKMLHVRTIKSAIQAAIVPSLATHSKLRAAVVVEDDSLEAIQRAKARHATSSKQFACFISHHKADCAMEARFMKDKLELMLGVF